MHLHMLGPVARTAVQSSHRWTPAQEFALVALPFPVASLTLHAHAVQHMLRTCLSGAVALANSICGTSRDTEGTEEIKTAAA